MADDHQLVQRRIDELTRDFAAAATLLPNAPIALTNADDTCSVLASARNALIHFVQVDPANRARLALASAATHDARCFLASHQDYVPYHLQEAQLHSAVPSGALNASTAPMVLSYLPLTLLVQRLLLPEWIAGMDVNAVYKLDLVNSIARSEQVWLNSERWMDEHLASAAAWDASTAAQYVKFGLQARSDQRERQWLALWLTFHPIQTTRLLLAVSDLDSSLFVRYTSLMQAVEAGRVISPSLRRLLCSSQSSAGARDVDRIAAILGAWTPGHPVESVTDCTDIMWNQSLALEDSSFANLSTKDLEGMGRELVDLLDDVPSKFHSVILASIARLLGHLTTTISSLPSEASTELYSVEYDCVHASLGITLTLDASSLAVKISAVLVAPPTRSLIWAIRGLFGQSARLIALAACLRAGLQWPSRLLVGQISALQLVFSVLCLKAPTNPSEHDQAGIDAAHDDFRRHVPGFGAFQRSESGFRI
ncbi:hypothetical protein CAOG_07567 [Capsaspora owczarzaki ATCC 30864]|uniref:hypothetical protein n=1 Tax=Capsaspora owczarzaki (strain ATCC 30864) TaxID=595528 RepID=UPI0001FE4B14|nr:hypothetical protein CAOG_07567 [Capsaspora owczarzaki ATCC 30864]|eukprot:XP_004343441.1 hypothetical protein CAOG_07567 [Capsaspora owczarzaki ATCC 30864]